MSFLCFLFLAVALDVVYAVNPVVDLSYSVYQGTALRNGISQWLGMRYAAPPVGELRWLAPQDPYVDTTLQTANTVRLFPFIDVLFKQTYHF